MPKLTDEQAKAVNHDSGNILISASAGSGKTHTMIERIKRIMLQKNVSVSQILCVTFTEKAAFEMKEKLKNALKENLDGPSRQRLMQEMIELSTADICTLHAFCGRLIRNYFFMVGVSPDFSIIDQAQSEVMRNESLDKVMRELYESGEDWFYALVDRHESSRTDKKLRKLVLDVYSFYNSEPNPQEKMQAHSSCYTEEGVNALLNEYKQALNFSVSAMILQAQEYLPILKSEGLDKGYAFTEQFVSAMQALVADDSLYAVKNAKFDLRLDFGKNLEDSAVCYKDRIKSLRDKYKDLVAKFAKHLTDEKTDLERLNFTVVHNQGVFKLVQAFADEYAKQKREENVLDFNDLEHFALQILSDEQTRESVREKYKYVFVDEYQDINGAQEKIIDLVADDNLFMVGDVKQSIYGFRGCRPEFFSKKFSSMEQNGQTVVTLNHNFRSAQNVVNMVNSIFDFCMTKEYFGYDYKQTSRLVAGADWATKHQGRAQIHFYHNTNTKKQEKQQAKVYDILKHLEQKEQSDNGASSLLTKIINEERAKTYYDFKADEYKRVTLKDIVILTRGKNTEFVASLVKGLNSHGISVSSEVKENACDFPEIDLLVNALKAVDCFEQSIPIASVMKSPIGDFTNEDLVHIIRFYEDEHGNENDWDFVDAYKYYLERATTPLRQKLAQFNEYFNGIRVLSDFVGAKGVLEKLIGDKNLESWLLAQPFGQSMLNRLHKFVNASVVSNKRLTVKEFLYKIENSEESFEFSNGIDQEDCVRVMTIHASKGLEFPVVIACGLERSFNTEDEWGDVLFSRNLGLGTRFFDSENRLKSETLLRGVIKEQMKLERTKEEMRLFYVATTRAMFSLHLTFEAKDDMRKSIFYGAEKFTDYIPSYLSATEYFPEDFEFINKTKQTKMVLISNANKEICDQIKSNLAFNYEHDADCTLPLKTGVTSSIKNLDPEVLTHVLFDEQSPDIERGNIAHKILEYFNFNDIENFDSQIQSMIDNGIVSAEQVEKINLSRIKNAINGRVFDMAKDCILYREKQFIAGIPAKEVLDTVSSEQVVVQGVIDLLAIKKDKSCAYVFDYKYSSLDDNGLVLKYKKQLDLYALAVQNVLGIKVDKKVIINLFTGSIVTI